MKEQIQKHARKHIKGGCYLKVTPVYRGLKKKTEDMLRTRGEKLIID
jgi:hypothetical protein